MSGLVRRRVVAALDFDSISEEKSAICDASFACSEWGKYTAEQSCRKRHILYELASRINADGYRDVESDLMFFAMKQEYMRILCGVLEFEFPKCFDMDESASGGDNALCYVLVRLACNVGPKLRQDVDTPDVFSVCEVMLPKSNYEALAMVLRHALVTPFDGVLAVAAVELCSGSGVGSSMDCIRICSTRPLFCCVGMSSWYVLDRCMIPNKVSGFKDLLGDMNGRRGASSLLNDSRSMVRSVSLKGNKRSDSGGKVFSIVCGFMASEQNIEEEWGLLGMRADKLFRLMFCVNRNVFDTFGFVPVQAALVLFMSIEKTCGKAYVPHLIQKRIGELRNIDARPVYVGSVDDHTPADMYYFPEFDDDDDGDRGRVELSMLQYVFSVRQCVKFLDEDGGFPSRNAEEYFERMRSLAKGNPVQASNVETDAICFKHIQFMFDFQRGYLSRPFVWSRVPILREALLHYSMLSFRSWTKSIVDVGSALRGMENMSADVEAVVNGDSLTVEGFYYVSHSNVGREMMGDRSALRTSVYLKSRDGTICAQMSDAELEHNIVNKDEGCSFYVGTAQQLGLNPDFVSAVDMESFRAIRVGGSWCYVSDDYGTRDQRMRLRRSDFYNNYVGTDIFRGRDYVGDVFPVMSSLFEIFVCGYWFVGVPCVGWGAMLDDERLRRVRVYIIGVSAGETRHELVDCFDITCPFSSMRTYIPVFCVSDGIMFVDHSDPAHKGGFLVVRRSPLVGVCMYTDQESSDKGLPRPFMLRHVNSRYELVNQFQHATCKCETVDAVKAALTRLGVRKALELDDLCIGLRDVLSVVTRACSWLCGTRRSWVDFKSFVEWYLGWTDNQSLPTVVCFLLSKPYEYARGILHGVGAVKEFLMDPCNVFHVVTCLVEYGSDYNETMAEFVLDYLNYFEKKDIPDVLIHVLSSCRNFDDNVLRTLIHFGVNVGYTDAYFCFPFYHLVALTGNDHMITRIFHVLHGVGYDFTVSSPLISRGYAERYGRMYRDAKMFQDGMMEPSPWCPDLVRAGKVGHLSITSILAYKGCYMVFVAIVENGVKASERNCVKLSDERMAGMMGRTAEAFLQLLERFDGRFSLKRKVSALEESDGMRLGVSGGMASQPGDVVIDLFNCDDVEPPSKLPCRA